MIIVKVFLLTTLSFIVALIWVPGLLRFLYKYKLGKKIRDRESAPIYSKLHQKKSGIPTMGGIVVWGTVAFLAAVFHYLPQISFFDFLKPFDFLTRSQTWLPLGVLVASAIVGIVDDLFNIKRIGKHGGGLGMRHRILVYAVIAIVGAWWFYFKLGWDFIHIPFLGNFVVDWWYIPIFIFIIVATSFSVNETDGLDGLAGGTLLASFAAFGAIAFSQGKVELATFCGVVVGALFAFLWFNIYPAKFFMGDTGAMSLGVTLGVVAMLTNSMFLLPIIGSIFVLESASVIIQLTSKRLRQGKKVFLSAPIHHHLEAKGWPEPQIVMRFWVIAAVSAVIGVIIHIADKGL